MTSSPDRRSFLSRLGAGAAAFAAAVSATPSEAVAQPAPWIAARHPEDDWMETIPGRHRFFYDSSTATGAGDAITFATNFYTANRSGYNLGEKDLAVIICLRHWSTPFAWSDAMWAKYGAPISERIKFVDPRTSQPPTVNVYTKRDYGMQLPNRGTTLDVMIQRGVHFAVCDMATRAYSGLIAAALKLQADEVYKDLREHSIPNTHYVAAGIVAVQRAQSRGYALAWMG